MNCRSEVLSRIVPYSSESWKYGAHGTVLYRIQFRSSSLTLLLSIFNILYKVQSIKISLNKSLLYLNLNLSSTVRFKLIDSSN